MGLALYLSGTDTLATTHAFSANAGTPSTAWELDLWYNKGTAGGSAQNIRMSIEVEDPDAPGTYRVSGLQPLDKHEFRARVVGALNPGSDPLQTTRLTDWVYLGTGVTLAPDALRGDCAWQLEIEYAPRLDTSAASGSWSWRIGLSYAESVEAASVGVSEGSGIGILTGVGDPSVSEWVEAPTVTETGTPDDYVQVSRRWAVLEGVSRRWLAEAVQLDQTDGNTDTLASGEAYVAVLSQGVSAITATKGAKAALASVTTPATPAGELLIAAVTVLYDASTFSVIEDADITAYADDGRGVVKDAGGLDVTVARLRAMVGRAVVTRPTPETVTLADDSTTTIWLTDSGLVSAVSGVLALAEVVTASGSVSSVTDLRTYVEPGAEVIRLAAAGTETAAANQARVRIPYRWCLDRVYAGLRAASSGATGATTIDVDRQTGATAVTLFTNQGGSPESRPSIAAQAYADDAGYPEVTTGDAGSWLSLDVDSITSGGTQGEDLEVGCVVYRLP